MKHKVRWHQGQAGRLRIRALELKLRGLSYAEVGIELNRSRQRIQQLLSPPNYIRSLIFEKAGGKCEVCGIFVGKNGHIHHKGTPMEDYNDVKNLSLLCPACHRHAHRIHEHRERMTKKERSVSGELIKGTVERNIQIRSMKAQGIRTFEIAKHFNLSWARIHSILNKDI